MSSTLVREIFNLAEFKQYVKPSNYLSIIDECGSCRKGILLGTLECSNWDCEPYPHPNCPGKILLKEDGFDEPVDICAFYLTDIDYDRDLNIPDEYFGCDIQILSKTNTINKVGEV